MGWTVGESCRSDTTQSAMVLLCCYTVTEVDLSIAALAFSSRRLLLSGIIFCFLIFLRAGPVLVSLDHCVNVTTTF